MIACRAETAYRFSSYGCEHIQQRWLRTYSAAIHALRTLMVPRNNKASKEGTDHEQFQS
jgi:hypothetical protein